MTTLGLFFLNVCESHASATQTMRLSGDFLMITAQKLPTAQWDEEINLSFKANKHIFKNGELFF